MHLSLGMNNKLIRGAALLFVCCMLSLCLLPFSPTVHAASPFDVGTVKDVTVKASNTDTSSSVTEPLGCTVTVTPFQPTLVNYDINTEVDSCVLRFTTSTGAYFDGTISQSGNAKFHPGTMSSSTTHTYISGTNTSSSTHYTLTDGYIQNFKLTGLPTSASVDYQTTTTSLYLYEEKFDVYFSIRNYSGSVYQYNVTPPRIEMALDVGHITGTVVGGEISQIDGFGELGFQRVTETSNGQLKIAVTAASDYIYSNRITLAPGQYLHGHFVVSAFVLRTDTTTAVPTVNTITLTGCDVARPYDGVTPSVLWNLYYINQKLDHILTAPSNSSTVTGESEDQLGIIDQQHTTEQSYFEQNAQNLQATGISNFQFDGDQVNSLTALTTDFTSLWNALGEWKFIYLFTLMISLATFIIRHRSQSSGRRTSDKGSSHG